MKTSEITNFEAEIKISGRVGSKFQREFGLTAIKKFFQSFCEIMSYSNKHNEFTYEMKSTEEASFIGGTGKQHSNSPCANFHHNNLK